jgi:hypothetical protein
MLCSEDLCVFCQDIRLAEHFGHFLLQKDIRAILENLAPDKALFWTIQNPENPGSRKSQLLIHLEEGKRDEKAYHIFK